MDDVARTVQKSTGRHYGFFGRNGDHPSFISTIAY
jgi:hypothetical protein